MGQHECLALRFRVKATILQQTFNCSFWKLFRSFIFALRILPASICCVKICKLLVLGNIFNGPETLTPWIISISLSWILQFMKLFPKSSVYFTFLISCISLFGRFPWLYSAKYFWRKILRTAEWIIMKFNVFITTFQFWLKLGNRNEHFI